MPDMPDPELNFSQKSLALSHDFPETANLTVFIRGLGLVRVKI